jgi:DNA polymerase V
MITDTYQFNTEELSVINKRERTEEDYPVPVTTGVGDCLNLNDYVVRHPESTFFSKVEGSDAERLGVRQGDILVIDRSLAPRHNGLVIAWVEAEYQVCRLLKEQGGWVLEQGSSKQVPIKFGENFHSPVWGCVTHVIHAV